MKEFPFRGCEVRYIDAGKWLAAALLLALPVFVHLLTNPALVAAQGQNLQNGSVTVGGVQRTFVFSVPSELGANRPLLFMLHGGGGTSQSARQETIGRFEQLGQQHKFITVYPNGINGWNDCRTGYPDKSTQNDVAFFAAMIDLFRASYAIDPLRVYVAGNSNGGGMALRLGIELPDRIAAIAVGHMQIARESQCAAPTAPMPIIYEAGTLDPAVPFGGGCVTPVPNVCRGRVASADEHVAFWVANNRVNSQPVVTDIPDTVDEAARAGAGLNTTTRKFAYAAGAGGAPVIFYRINNGGHSWSAPRQMPFSADAGMTSLDYVFCDEVWTFFSTGNGGDFFRRGAASAAATVSAASYNGAPLAAEMIATVFGSGLAGATLAATTLPLPTQLAGVMLKVRDSAGVERDAPLFFVAPTQLNFLIPAGTRNGAAALTVVSNDKVAATGALEIAAIAPGLFTADASGRGLAAATALRVRANGAQEFEPVARFDPAQSRFVAVPIDLGPEDEQVFLLLFGTGVRGRSALSAVAAKVGGVDAQVTYAGAQSDFAGLDQVNVRLPRALVGRGEVDVQLLVDGQAVNPVKVSIK